jgi:hypothetical protein
MSMAALPRQRCGRLFKIHHDSGAVVVNVLKIHRGSGAAAYFFSRTLKKCMNLIEF